MQDDPLMSTLEVAYLLGVSPRTVEDWRADGRGPKYIVIEGRKVRYRRSVVQAYLEARTVQP